MYAVNLHNTGHIVIHVGVDVRTYVRTVDDVMAIALHTESAPAVHAAVKTVLSCQSFALSPETVHFGCA